MCLFLFFMGYHARYVVWQGNAKSAISPDGIAHFVTVKQRDRSKRIFKVLAMVTRKTCCIDDASAARIIGAYTMSISILMINVFVSNFFSRNKDEDFFESVKTWAILGLNWMQAFNYTHLQKKVQTAMVCFLIYVILFLIASAYLTLGLISRRHKYAVPWMYLQMISIIDQTVALSDHIIQDRQNTTSIKSLTCSVYLILSIYLWTVVQAARKQLYEEQQNHVECEPRLSDPLPVSPTNSGLKSPSFLSQNFPRSNHRDRRRFYLNNSKNL